MNVVLVLVGTYHEIQDECQYEYANLRTKVTNTRLDVLLTIRFLLLVSDFLHVLQLWLDSGCTDPHVCPTRHPQQGRLALVAAAEAAELYFDLDPVSPPKLHHGCLEPLKRAGPVLPSRCDIEAEESALPGKAALPAQESALPRSASVCSRRCWRRAVVRLAARLTRPARLPRASASSPPNSRM